MSSIVSLKNVANQSFSQTLDGDVYDITLKAVSEQFMTADISRNDSIVISGARVVGGVPLIPYRYLEQGNFIFLTLDDEAPYYTLFNVTQSLLFTTETELDNLRG